MKSIEHSLTVTMLARRIWHAEIARYLIAGAINTSLTYAAYLLLLPWIPYQAAYGLTYALGLVIGYALNAQLVFGQPLRWRSALQFPAVSLVQYGLAALSLEVLIALGMSTGLAGLLSIVPTLPVTFVISRWIIKPKSASMLALEPDLTA